MKENKQTYIDFIIDCFNKGVVERIDVMAMFGKKWQKPTRTFDRYFKSAKETFLITQNSIKQAKEVQTITNEIDKLKTLNLTKIDRMKIAEGIAMGKAKRIEGQIIVPSHSDQLKALDYLAKIEGDYAPTKQANTNAKGDDKEEIIIYTDNQVDKIIEVLKKK
jgi:hypothetical protein